MSSSPTTKTTASPAKAASPARRGGSDLYMEPSPKARGLSVAAGLLGAAVMAMLGYAVQTYTWYEVTSDSDKLNFGLFKSCKDSRCAEIEFAGSTSCGLTESNLKMRYWVIRALFLFQAFGAFVQCVLSLAGCQRGASARSTKFMLGATLLSLLSGAAGTAMYAVSSTGYFFCKKKYCEMVAGLVTSCSEGFGMSFFVGAAAMGPGLLAVILAIVVIVQRGKQQAEEDGRAPLHEEAMAPTSPKAGGGSPGPKAGAGGANSNASGSPKGGASETQQPASPGQEASQPLQQNEEEEGETFTPPPGDWVFDEESEMYWSEENYLFLNPSNGHYYNPESDKWYDPVSGEWYGGAE